MNNDVQIIFNGVRDFENGVVLEDWTILNVQFNDTVSGGVASPTGDGWELYVRSEDNEIWSESGSSSLPLSTIELRVYYDGSDHGPFPLTNSNIIPIAFGSDQVSVNEDIIISYDCGTKAGNRIEGFSEQYFIVNLIFTLQPDPYPLLK